MRRTARRRLSMVLPCRLRQALLVLCLAVIPMEQASADDLREARIRQSLQRFYRYIQILGFDGIPGEFDQKILRPLLSEDLASLLGNGLRLEIEHTEACQNSEPPAFQGSIFCSLFEGFTTFRIERIVRIGDTARAEIHFESRDPRPDRGDVTTWTDTVELRRSSRGWGIDNVFYGGDWEFKLKGDLQTNLRNMPGT